MSGFAVAAGLIALFKRYNRGQGNASIRLFIVLLPNMLGELTRRFLVRTRISVRNSWENTRLRLAKEKGIDVKEMPQDLPNEGLA